MKTVRVADTTLRKNAEGNGKTYNFREKTEIARILDNMGVDTVEMPLFTGNRADVLLLHTVAPVMKNAVICCTPVLKEETVRACAEALASAANARICIAVPTSAVQLEYRCHKKPAAALAMIKESVALAVSLGVQVEFAAEDATRAEPEFLQAAIAAAIEAGACCVTVCDSVGTMLPNEVPIFFATLVEKVPALVDVEIGFEPSDALHLGTACAVAALAVGVSRIKTAVGIDGVTETADLAAVLQTRGAALSAQTSLNHALLSHSASEIAAMAEEKTTTSPFENGVREMPVADFVLRQGDDSRTVAACVRSLGYELSVEDEEKVYESVCRMLDKKTIGPKELNAIVAGTAMQVEPTYTLKSYVINCGNILRPTAQIELEKDGKVLSGICFGDGPIDAAFLAIEQIVGHHFELDDFQIRSLTEGREAVGETVVCLRKDGKLYSGRGVSTDIIGSGIRAYVSALNKICFEENL